MIPIAPVVGEELSKCSQIEMCMNCRSPVENLTSKGC